MTSDVAGAQIRPESGFEHLTPVLAEYVGLCVDDPRRAALREVLVTGYLPVARRLALRYRQRGVPLEDLEQIASIGLIQALDRFHPQHGNTFLGFAVPTMTGEIRRHFRDYTWSMRVPRAIKDLHVAINKASAQLYQELGRAPRPSELAKRLKLPLAEVLGALEAGHAYNADSLDEPFTAGDQSTATLTDTLGVEDTDLEQVEYHEALQPLLAALPARERAILMMRFYGNMTQSDIAERIGISQMHVSRLLTRTLTQLRKGMETG